MFSITACGINEVNSAPNTRKLDESLYVTNQDV